MIRAMAPSARGLAMLVFSLLIAGSFSFGTRIAHLLNPAALMALRFLLSGMIVGALVWAGPGFRRAHYAAPWRYLVLGGLFATYFLLMFEGLKSAKPISASAVFVLVPGMTAFFGFFLLRQPISGRVLIALLIGAAGAVWVIFDGQAEALLTFEVGRGEAIYFVGCIAHAIYSPMARRLNRGEPNVAYTFATIVAGFMVVFLLGLPDLAAADWRGFPDPMGWAGLSGDLFHRRDVSFAELRLDDPAQWQGDGLYISDAILGGNGGIGADRCRAECRDPGRCAGHGTVGADLAARLNWRRC